MGKKTQVKEKQTGIRGFINTLVDKAVDRILKGIEDALKKAVASGYEKRCQEIKNYFKQTERRLYSYPELYENIQKYTLDIQDLEREFFSEKSKDMVKFSENSGIRLTPQEIQQARIESLKRKIKRDQAEIDEINYALNAVKDDEYYMIVEYKYFDGMKDVEIGEKMYCDESTVRRHKNKLLQRIMVRLYGADVI